MFAQQLEQLLIGFAVLLPNLIIEIGTVEAGDVDRWIAQFELNENVIAHPLGRRGSQGQQGSTGVTFAQASDLAIFGTKIMPPLADTVSLVNGQQREANGRLRLIHNTQEIL